MVYLKDEGSYFEAPIDFVWKYIFDSDLHGTVHKTTRNGKFEKVSEITFLFGSERLLRGKWAPDQLRITVVPPVCVVTEWLEGVLAGSKLAYLYRPEGANTRIDAYGEFSSKTLSPGEIEATAREFLDTEFAADAPAIRDGYLRHTPTPAKSSPK